MTETKPTAGPWRGVAHTGYIYSDDAVVAVVGGFLTDEDLIPFNGERWAADTKLIVALENGARSINPSNPMAVAEGIEEIVDLLQKIKRFGELACVDAEPRNFYSGGKKPATKDVWQFPRHMMTNLDTLLSRIQSTEAAQ